MTPKQAKIYDFVAEHIRDMGFAPTLDEIGQRFGVSSVTAREHIKALESKGLLRTERNRARSIELVDTQAETRWPDIRLCGRIAAGMPIEAVDNGERFDFDGLFPDDRDVFVLEVKGNSMIEEHIQDGDLVVCESRDQARNGETVVALIGDQEATLKHFFLEGNRVRLEPANAAMSAIIRPATEVKIQGVVIGVIRRF
ncbi:MAG: transcriptional repressor LexA [Planctomycetota bacterium]